MDELLISYGGQKTDAVQETSDDAAFILHTSGTTGGAGKPVVLSDAAFNAAAAAFYDIMNADEQDDGFDLELLIKPWKILERIMPEKKPFKMPEIPEGVRKAVLKYGNRLAGIPHGRKSIPFDFED